MKGLVQGLYTVCEWIMRLAYLNILWMFFSLLGVVIVGVFPSTIAMFEVIKKWLNGEWDIPIFKYFWTSYKKSFIKANLLGALLLLIGIILFIDFNFFAKFDHLVMKFLASITIVMFIIFSILLIYIFPVFVYYEISIFQCIKFACTLGISRPLSTIGVVIATLLLYYIFSSFPFMLILFGGSLISIIIMWITKNTLNDIRAKFT